MVNLKYWDSAWGRFCYSKNCLNLEYFLRCYERAKKDERMPVLYDMDDNRVWIKDSEVYKVKSIDKDCGITFTIVE
jgi:hypothetical protein